MGLLSPKKPTIMAKGQRGGRREKRHTRLDDVIEQIRWKNARFEPGYKYEGPLPEPKPVTDYMQWEELPFTDYETAGYKFDDNFNSPYDDRV